MSRISPRHPACRLGGRPAPSRSLRPTALAALVGLVVMLAACSTGYHNSKIRDPRADLQADRAGEGPDGKEHRLRGQASWYGEALHGQTTASGEPFDMYAFTAAHKTLPFDTIVRVIDRETLKSVVVRINDRGPYADGRIIDLSRAAASDLDMVSRGVAPVRLEVLRWGKQ